MIKKIKFSGLDCPNCAKKLEEQINKLTSIKFAKIDFFKSFITIESENIDLAIQEMVSLTKQMFPDVKYAVSTNSSSNKKEIILDFSLLLTGIVLGLITLFIKTFQFAKCCFF